MVEHTGTDYRPATVSPPGDTLVDLLEERGLSQAELAQRMGRPAKTINEIIKGKAAITSDTAMQLERVLGTPADFWLAREARYQGWRARRDEVRRLADCGAWLGELPVRDMVKRGWIPKASGVADRVAACLGFFGVASVDAWRQHYSEPLAAFRRSTKVTSSVGAIAAWLRRGEIEASRLSCGAFDHEAFRDALMELRALTCETDPKVFVPRLTARCAAMGVAVAFVPTPTGCPASGATRWLAPDRALLQLCLRYRSNDHMWFTFFHEAAHILLHGKRLLFLESVGAIDAQQEAEADRYAANVLIPTDAARRLADLRKTTEAVKAFAAEIGIAPGIVVGRMQKDGQLPWTHLNGLKTRYAWQDERR